MINWFEENGVAFLGSMPCSGYEFKNISEMNGDKGSYIGRVVAQMGMLFSNLGSEGGLCIVVGKKE